jgi:hypothetical protein
LIWLGFATLPRHVAVLFSKPVRSRGKAAALQALAHWRAIYTSV